MELSTSIRKVFLPNGKVGRNRCHVLQLPQQAAATANGLHQMYDFRIFNTEIIAVAGRAEVVPPCNFRILRIEDYQKSGLTFGLAQCYIIIATCSVTA